MMEHRANKQTRVNSIQRVDILWNAFISHGKLHINLFVSFFVFDKDIAKSNMKEGGNIHNMVYLMQ